jgi:hypothetical protein
MIKLIGSGILGAVTVAGAGYNYVTTQNATIESQRRAISETQQKFENADASDKRKGVLIDHVIQELRQSRGDNG